MLFDEMKLFSLIGEFFVFYVHPVSSPFHLTPSSISLLYSPPLVVPFIYLKVKKQTEDISGRGESKSIVFTFKKSYSSSETSKVIKVRILSQ